MQGHQNENWGPRIALVAACVLGALFALSGTSQAQFNPPTTLDMANTDGGVVNAPPRQLTPNQVACGTSQKTVIIQNPNDTDMNPGLCNIRVGNSRVRAFPVNRKNGIVLAPGQSISLDIYASGNPSIISECTTDAGVSAGVLCGSGGLK